jgi:hypothetical protein
MLATTASAYSLVARRSPPSICRSMSYVTVRSTIVCSTASRTKRLPNAYVYTPRFRGMKRVGPAGREPIEAVESVHLTQLAGGDRTDIQAFETEPIVTVPEHSRHVQTGLVSEGAPAVLDERLRVEAGASFAVPGDGPHGAVGPSGACGVGVVASPRPSPDRTE